MFEFEFGVGGCLSMEFGSVFRVRVLLLLGNTPGKFNSGGSVETKRVIVP